MHFNGGNSGFEDLCVPAQRRTLRGAETLPRAGGQCHVRLPATTKEQRVAGELTHLIDRDLEHLATRACKTRENLPPLAIKTFV
jgi:hypothetical protein